MAKKQKKKESKTESKRKTLKGVVVSTKMQKTVVVEVEHVKSHKLYKKIYRESKRFKAHSEDELNIGDEVEIEQTQPISKQKSWIIKKVL